MARQISANNSVPGAGSELAVTREKISLCMIAKNEEANISPCLMSVADLVDEMIVVDTGSSDRTKDVAAARGARVYDFTWIDSFAAARNESLRHATGDWIVWLDADDRFDHDNREKLRTLLAGLKKENVAYVMNLQAAILLAGDSGAVVRQVRLFRKDPRIGWHSRVHEQILPALRAARHEVRFTDIFVEHTGYCDPTVLRHKIERNVRLLHLQEAEEPDDRLTLFHLGWAYHDLGQLVRALQYLRRSLVLCRPRDSIVSKLYVLMAECHSALGQRSEALAACQAGVARCPDDVELLFQQERLLREPGESPAGAQACLRPLLPGETGPHFASFDAEIRGFKSGR